MLHKCKSYQGPQQIESVEGGLRRHPSFLTETRQSNGLYTQGRAAWGWDHFVMSGLFIRMSLLGCSPIFCEPFACDLAFDEINKFIDGGKTIFPSASFSIMFQHCHFAVRGYH